MPIDAATGADWADPSLDDALAIGPDAGGRSGPDAGPPAAPGTVRDKETSRPPIHPDVPTQPAHSDPAVVAGQAAAGHAVAAYHLGHKTPADMTASYTKASLEEDAAASAVPFNCDHPLAPKRDTNG